METSKPTVAPATGAGEHSMAEEKKWAPTREQELALTKVGTTPLIDALLQVAMWAEHAMEDSEFT
jgi:hypothetical protein